MKLIINTLDLINIGSGQGILDYLIRLKLRISFSAHNLIIFLGFDLQWPFLNLNSPSTYLSLSLNTKIDVLYILIANSYVPSKDKAWYTLASLPVDKHPFISFITLLLSSFIRITLVLGSRTYFQIFKSTTCSTVALSSLSFTLYILLASFVFSLLSLKYSLSSVTGLVFFFYSFLVIAY